MTDLENRIISLTDADSIAAVLHIDGDADPNNPTEDDVSLAGFVQDADTGTEILDVLPPTGGETEHFALTEIDTEGDEGVQTTPSYTWQAYSLEADIPDSVVHRWRCDEGSGSTLTDTVGGADVSMNFGTWTTDSNFVGGVAPNADGLDDDGEATISTSFRNAVENYDWGISFCIETTDDDAGLFGLLRDDDFVLFRVGESDAGSGELLVAIRNGGDLYITSDVAINDGTPTTVSVRVGGNQATDVDILVDGADATDVTRDESPSTLSLDNDFLMWDRWASSTSKDNDNIDAVLDDVRLYDEAPSISELEGYHNAHPST